MQGVRRLFATGARLETEHGCSLIGFGLWLMIFHSFTTNAESFRVMAEWGTEYSWGLSMCFVGLGQLVSIARDWRRGRQAATFANMWLWGNVIAALLLAEASGPAIPVYGVLFASSFLHFVFGDYRPRSPAHE